MSCGFSKDLLGLHVEGDLSPADADKTSHHLRTCDDCQQFLDELRATQSLLKVLRSDTARPSDCTPMRRNVMSIIEDRRERFGWALRIERAMMLGFGLRSYAFALTARKGPSYAIVALLVLVSASVLAQMRHTAPATTPAMQAAAVFEHGNTLVRPEGYRDWIRVEGATPAPGHSVYHSVYIDPAGYRGYKNTGRFPEGTLRIWEPAGGHPDTAPRPHNESALLASVKDSTRFDGGWGFFDFTAPDGTVTTRAQAVPESRGCGSCHRS